MTDWRDSGLSGSTSDSSGRGCRDILLMRGFSLKVLNSSDDALQSSISEQGCAFQVIVADEATEGGDQSTRV